MVQAARERYRALDAKIERMEAEEERRWQQARLQPRLRHGEVGTAGLRRIRPLGAAASLSTLSPGRAGRASEEKFVAMGRGLAATENRPADETDHCGYRQRSEAATNGRFI